MTKIVVNKTTPRPKVVAAVVDPHLQLRLGSNIFKRVYLSQNIAQQVTEMIDNLEENEETLNEIYIKDSKGNTIIDSTIAELPYCCGVEELGEISYNRPSSESVRTACKEIVLAVIQNIDKTIIVNTSTSQKGKPSKSRNFEEYLSPEWFTMVKEFTNPGTGNTIRMFVSNT